MSTSTNPYSSADDQRERLIPFPSPGRGGETEPNGYGPTPRRRDRGDGERAARRRPRRRHHTPWLQRNALSVAAISVLVALLGVGFGMVQLLNRPEATPTTVASGEPPDAAPAMTTLNAAVSSPPQVLNAAAAQPPARRDVQASVRVIEPTYTVEAGDTLGRIAVRYNTTVERLQALNNLPDPRTLRIGTRLIIPEPLESSR